MTMQTLDLINETTINYTANIPNDDLKTILAKIRSMNVDELEKLLKDELKSGSLGKYYLLASLRDIFKVYKDLGDSSLNYESGSCSKQCFKDCNVFNLKGNTSNKSLAFSFVKENNEIARIHPCPNFHNTKNQHVPADAQLFMILLNCESKMKGNYIEKKADSPEMTDRKLKQLQRVLNSMPGID